jgi:amino acid permease
VFTPGYAILLVSPLFFVMALLRSFRLLAVTSIIGDVVMVGAFAAVIAYGVADPHYGSFALPSLPVDASDFLRSVQTATFQFAVHANTLPISQAMSDPHTEFEPALYRSFTFAVVINAVFGLLAYGLFRSGTANPVTLNLGCMPGANDPANGFVCTDPEPERGLEHTLVKGVQVLLCIDLVFTLPIILSAAREIIENGVLSAARSSGVAVGKDDSIRNATRAALVCLIGVVSYLFPNFADILTFLGGLFQSLIAFVIPPLIFNRLHRDEISARQYAGNVAVMAFGAIMAVTSVLAIFVDV